jgi:uncharacterized SAM-dependent methyltransferase
MFSLEKSDFEKLGEVLKGLFTDYIRTLNTMIFIVSVAILLLINTRAIPLTVVENIAVFIIEFFILKIIVSYFKIMQFIQKINGKLENIQNELTDHLSKMVNHTLFTDDDTLEDKLKVLHSHNASSMWIISRFISKQISKNLSSLQFNIDANEYSKFSSELYKEVKQDLLLTYSINFYTWHELLGINIDGKAISPPQHIQAWNSLTINKKRLIILTDFDYNNLFVYEKYFKQFIEITDSKEENTRFICLEKFQEHSNTTEDLEILNYDYAIYDKSVLLRWENPIASKEATKIELTAERITNKYSDLLHIFEQNWDNLKTHEELREYITKQKQQFIRNTFETGILDHRYSYFAEGSQVWRTINNASSTSYTLGEKEQDVLKSFLSKKMHLDNYSKANIIHIGSGGGEEIISVLGSMPHNIISHYYVIDISSNMLNRAKVTLKNNFTIEKATFLEIDMLKNEFKAKLNNIDALEANKNIFLLASNGYLLSEENVIKNIVSAMSPDDILIITVEEVKSNNGIEEVASSYLIDEVIQLFNISLEFIKINNVTKKYFKPKHENDYFEIDFQIRDWFHENKATIENKDIEKYLEEIESLKIFKSYKPSQDGLDNKLKESGLCPYEKLEYEGMCGGIYKKCNTEN